MSKFLKQIEQHQAELDRLIEAQEHGTTMSYPLMRGFGVLKPFAVRLPITTIALLDELAKYGPWESKQEMVYEMIQSAFEEFYSASEEETRKRFDAIAKNVFDTWASRNKGAVVDRPTGKTRIKGKSKIGTGKSKQVKK